MSRTACGVREVEKAKLVATIAHAAIGQLRKYTAEPYIVHPAEVVSILETIPHTDEMLAAAWLHDVVEDTEVTFDILVKEFSPEAMRLVDWLTDPDGLVGNRATRKAAIRERWRDAPEAAKTIKLADIISNSRSIFERDPEFAKTYFKEIHDLLPYLEGGNLKLMQRVRDQLEEYSGIIH